MTTSNDGFDAQAFAGELMKDVDALGEWAEAAMAALVRGIADGLDEALGDLVENDRRAPWLEGYFTGLTDGRREIFDARIKESVESTLPASLGTLKPEGDS